MKVEGLVSNGLDSRRAKELLRQYEGVIGRAGLTKEEKWMAIAEEVLSPTLPFEIHVYVRDHFFGGSEQVCGPPLWYPSKSLVSKLNLTVFMRWLLKDVKNLQGSGSEELKADFDALLGLAWRDPEFYWRGVIEFMKLSFTKQPDRILSHDVEEDKITWLGGCRLNVAEVALTKIRDKDKSIIWAEEDTPNEISIMSGSELRALSYRFASGISALCPKGTSVAVYLPMTAISIAAYMGILLAGCRVVSIADSFAPPEVRVRLSLSDTKLIITQDVVKRAGKIHDLYSKISSLAMAKCIVIPQNLKAVQEKISKPDMSLDEFFKQYSHDNFTAIECDGYDHCNILFSSGTTGTPKAIPWTHLTPLKCGVDGMLCQNISSRSVVCWPTNLGWMMGPWLIFAAFLNEAPIALFQGSPVSAAFCRFVQKAGVTMLGVIPTMVRAWKMMKSTEGCDWSRIECFSSTGEASSYDEYHWLMAQAGYKPVVEYCGGTEIGGAYISSYLIFPQMPSAFTSPVVGSRVVHIRDDSIRDITEIEDFEGEIAMAPPMFGLSQTLLNRSHVEVYYNAMPRYGDHNYRLRRHGDVFTKTDGFYFSRGRCDDTMNLGGIKVSCVELEYAVMRGVNGVKEAAAVGFTSSSGGPEELALFLVVSEERKDVGELKKLCQKAIREQINPLFKVSRVCLKDALPRTSTNKITRNILRDEIKSWLS